MAHLALAVHDEERSRRFYERYFGFDAGPTERAEDGVVMFHNADGFSLALAETDEQFTLPRFLHFAFAPAEHPADVRALRERMSADGVEIVGEWDEPEYVSFKCRDPDGYVAEVYWEPAA